MSNQNDQNMMDRKRFAIVPLSFEKNKDRALPGEIVVDDKTGNIWVRNRNTNELVCATQDVCRQVEEGIEAHLGEVYYAINHNRSVNRFYFNEDAVRLDNSLNFPAEYVYFQIRDIKDASKYYLVDYAEVTKAAFLINPGNHPNAFVNNGTYIVEFYNLNFELVSQVVFTGRRAPVTSLPGLDKYVDRIEIAVNRDILYVGENIKSLNARVYAIMGDSSYRDATDMNDTQLMAYQMDVEGNSSIENLVKDAVDVTKFNSTAIDLSEIDVTKEGTFKIRATFMDKINNRVLEAYKTIQVSRTAAANLIPDGIAVVVKYMGTVNGQDDFRLRAIGYFEDNSVRDITGNVIFSKKNDLKFDANGILENTIIVTFNSDTSVQNSYEVPVILYRDLTTPIAYKKVEFVEDEILPAGILRLDRKYVNGFIPASFKNEAVYYRIAKVVGRGKEMKLEYITPVKTPIGYDAQYSGMLEDGETVIVEFYAGGTYDLLGVDTLIASSVSELR